MLDPERFASTARLTQVQPYDPKKILVLFVHGPSEHAGDLGPTGEHDLGKP